MNYSGEIRLYNGKHELHSFHYWSREERSTIIERWKLAYPNTIHAFDIHILPTVVDRSEIVGKQTRLDKLQVASKERYERPPSVYSNSKSLYGDIYD